MLSNFDRQNFVSYRTLLSVNNFVYWFQVGHQQKTPSVDEAFSACLKELK
ncbi:hypothetical protein ACE1B6_03770 [Aerosakkonemataceae cyanobacterium BLCC-F154]|uniref:Uncharacterized protein n=1 Tax=Floridaenema fluviatile BLCC-F154 TaxID=3153640 RepID=A0ABV4Y6E5_9CYAN